MLYTATIQTIYLLLNKEGALKEIQWFKDALYELSLNFYGSLYNDNYGYYSRKEEEKFPLPQDPELISSNVFINSQDAYKWTMASIENVYPEKIIVSGSEKAGNIYSKTMEFGKKQDCDREQLGNIPWWRFKMKRKKQDEIEANEYRSNIPLPDVLSILAYYYCEKEHLGPIDEFNEINLKMSRLRVSNM